MNQAMASLDDYINNVYAEDDWMGNLNQLRCLNSMKKK